MLVIAIAWVFYRPLIGITLLVAVGVGVYFIFFFNKGEYAVVDDALLVDDTAAMTPATPAQ